MDDFDPFETEESSFPKPKQEQKNVFELSSFDSSSFGPIQQLPRQQEFVKKETRITPIFDDDEVFDDIQDTLQNIEQQKPKQPHKRVGAISLLKKTASLRDSSTSSNFNQSKSTSDAVQPIPNSEGVSKTDNPPSNLKQSPFAMMTKKKTEISTVLSANEKVEKPIKQESPFAAITNKKAPTDAVPVKSESPFAMMTKKKTGTPAVLPENEKAENPIKKEPPFAIMTKDKTEPLFEQVKKESPFEIISKAKSGQSSPTEKEADSKSHVDQEVGQLTESDDDETSPQPPQQRSDKKPVAQGDFDVSNGQASLFDSLKGASIANSSPFAKSDMLGQIEKPCGNAKEESKINLTVSKKREFHFREALGDLTSLLKPMPKSCVNDLPVEQLLPMGDVQRFEDTEMAKELEKFCSSVAK